MATQGIDLKGVPEGQARAVEEQVPYWREQATKKAKPVEFSRWQDKVIGRLTREEIYDDVV